MLLALEGRWRWWWAGTARRSGTILPCGVWAEPSENAVVPDLFCVLFEQ